MDQLHRALGRAHAELYWLLRARDGERGQGTVEYAAIMLLVATVLTFAVQKIKADDGANLAGKITGKLNQAIDDVKSR